MNRLAETLKPRTDFAAVNAVGTMVRTFETADAAHRWVHNHLGEFTDLHVEEVTYTVSRRRLNAPRIVKLEACA